MYQLKFTLKQHTPLIHFQHDQEGATLRASEVKPKLDRFIVHWLKNVDKQLYLKYKDLLEKKLLPCIIHKNQSLYKISISSEIDKKVFLFSLTSQADANLIKQHVKSQEICGNNPEVYWKTPLFCNNSLLKFEGNHKQGNRIIHASSKWEELKIGIWLKNINLCVLTQDKEMCELISECLPYLFAFENFGLRQSKGFGSFNIENQNERHIKSFIGNDSVCVYKKQDSSSWDNKIESIREFWKLLKAGDSFGTYYKSDIMKYYCMLDGTRWEKRKIKKSLHLNHASLYNSLKVANPPNRIAGCISDPTNPSQVSSNQNYMYVRALMGLAEHFEFGISGSNPLKIKISNSDVERFKSPITIKVNDVAIYLICFPIEPGLSNYGNNLFSFDIDATNGNLANLSIPFNFSLEHFLDSPWLGNNFEKSNNWTNYGQFGQTNYETVALHHKFIKLKS
jgi:hypothetical protein